MVAVPTSLGHEVAVTQPNLYELLYEGSLPDPLTSFVESLIYQLMTIRGMATEQERNEAATFNAQLVQKPADAVVLYRHIICLAATEPRICNSIAEVRQLRTRGVAAHFVGEYADSDLSTIYTAALGVGGQLIDQFQSLSDADEDDVLEPVPNDAHNESSAVVVDGPATT